jgi:hypothetical protein
MEEKKDSELDLAAAIWAKQVFSDDRLHVNDDKLRRIVHLLPLKDLKHGTGGYPTLESLISSGLLPVCARNWVAARPRPSGWGDNPDFQGFELVPPIPCAVHICDLEIRRTVHRLRWNTDCDCKGRPHVGVRPMFVGRRFKIVARFEFADDRDFKQGAPLTMASLQGDSVKALSWTRSAERFGVCKFESQKLYLPHGLYTLTWSADAPFGLSSGPSFVFATMEGYYSNGGPDFLTGYFKSLESAAVRETLTKTTGWGGLHSLLVQPTPDVVLSPTPLLRKVLDTACRHQLEHPKVR